MSLESALDEANRLDEQVEKLYDDRKLQEAVPLAERGLALRELTLEPVHSAIATSLDNLALLYSAQGAHGKAEPLYVRALEIREKLLGPRHPDTAASLGNLATLYQAQGAYPKAEPLFARALEIREAALGPAHPDVRKSLNNLAFLLWAQGEYDRAEPLYTRAVDLYQNVLGPMHPDVASILSNFGMLYQDKGAYEKAEALHVRALDIREKALGPRNLDMAESLNNLAALHKAQGNYAKAEPLYIRALDIFEQALGPMHPNVGMIVNNFATLYDDQGAYTKAEPLYVRALHIAESVFGPIHPYVAMSLNNLAGLYRAQEDYEKAEPLYVRALGIRETTQGPSHPGTAQGLNNLGVLYQAQGEYGKAEPLFLRALDISEKVLGPSHPEVATSLHNLAMLHQQQGVYGKAEALFARALDIRDKVLGPVHPEVAKTLNKLAGLYQAQHAYETAAPLYHRAAEIREQQLRIELTRLSELRKRALMALLKAETDSLVSFHADAAPHDEAALELALTTVMRRKGRVLDSLVDHEIALRAHITPALRVQLDELGDARTELARLHARTGRDRRTDAAAIAVVRARIDDLENALSAASAEFRAQSESATVAKIQATLPLGTALVEFVRYQPTDAQPADLGRNDRYIAYLVTSHGPPECVALLDAAPIDAQIDTVLAALQGTAPDEATKTALRCLDELVLAPIRARLTDVSHLMLAPDGNLNLVPFEALIDSDGRYALDTYLVSYVTTGRDLLRLAVPPMRQSPAVIMAGPDYGSPGGAGTAMFPQLHDMREEATDLQAYFPIALTGDRATKAALAQLTGPALLHIATHGFYTRDHDVLPTQIPPRSSRDVTVKYSDARPQSPPRLDDPADALDRAGLALAGANHSADGIVTAREIAGFDWQGTQLVVLSACQTGVGAVQSGDGVYGLRRALVLAGAASQVVSLWSVSDSSTRALMRDYYAELVRGTGRAEALRRAKLQMMRHPSYAHPYYWAAFIPAGDWRPLDPSVFSQASPDS
jgi:CHAT domain-containing protein/Flp pilus assembly protein TadD